MPTKLVTAILLLAISLTAQADFNAEGKGKLTYPTGTTADFAFGLSVKSLADGYLFKAGQQELEVSQIPEKYSIWLGLHKDQHVFVQEFARNYFETFEWQLGDHKIRLQKKVLSPKRAPGDYVLSIDHIDYFFQGKQGQIEILLDENGITAIEANGFTKDIGMSK